MIKIEETEVVGWEHAIRGMRNPLESWKKSDSAFIGEIGFQSFIGEDDLALMKKLVHAGSDHSKFMRMITVYCDIIAPLYWWKEFDTYKVGTVANSCSTMHKITDKPITENDFSIEDDTFEWFFDVVDDCESLRELYLETKDKKYWKTLIQILPSGYNQKRTVMLNYQVLRNMYYSRKNHRLDEWQEFCKWIESLPYAKELIIEE